MNAIIAMIIKDYKLLLRNKTSAFFVLAFPLIFAAFFGSVYNRSDSTPNLEISVLDNDNSNISRDFAKRLAEHEAITIIKPKQNTTDALDFSIKRKEISAYIVVPKGFSEQYEQAFSANAPSVQLVTDPKQPETAMILTGMLKELAAERFASMLDNEKLLNSLPQDTPEDIVSAINVLTNAASQESEKETSAIKPSFNPINVIDKPLATRSLDDDTPNSGFVFILPQAAIWICIGLVTAFVSFIGIEATSGNLLRLSLSPFRKLRFLVAKGLAVFFAQIALIALFYSVTWLFIGFSFDTVSLVLSVLATALAFTGIMLGFAAFVDSQSSSAGSLVNAVLLLAGMIGGAMIPIAFMPKWMLSVSQFSPVYHVIYALEGATWRGLELSDIVLSLIVLIGIGLLGLGVSLAKFRYVQGER